MITLKLRHRVGLYKEVEKRGDMGFVKSTPTKISTIWAEVKSVKGSEAIQDGELFDSELVHVVIRYRRNVNTEFQIEYNNNMYNIIYMQELGTREGLKLTCKKLKK